jgi:hypothetical protein
MQVVGPSELVCLVLTPQLPRKSSICGVGNIPTNMSGQAVFSSGCILGAYYQHNKAKNRI